MVDQMLVLRTCVSSEVCQSEQVCVIAERLKQCCSVSVLHQVRSLTKGVVAAVFPSEQNFAWCHRAVHAVQFERGRSCGHCRLCEAGQEIDRTQSLHE